MKNSILFFAILALSLSSCKVSEYASNARPVTHEIWDSLLQTHVTDGGLVDYEGFIQDSARFNQYLDLLSKHHPNKKHWSKDERLAYWINAYNAFTVKLVADYYPVESIKDIKKGIPFVNTVWDIKFIEIEGQSYDLNNIEHGIIRPRFEEPRIHFAVNCAAISCPKLWNRAYTANQLDAQLDQAARSFLADEGKNQITANNPKLSKIFSWYGGDFKTKKRSIIDYVNEYTDVDISQEAEVEYLDYDWGLNKQ